MSEVKRGALQSPADTARTTDTIVRHVQIVGDDGTPMPSGTDSSNPITVKQHVVDLIDEGKLFRNAFYYTGIENAAVEYILIKAGTKYPHVKFIGQASGNATIELYYNPTVTLDGIEELAGPFNLNTLNTPLTTWFPSPTIGDDGIYIANTFILGGSGVGTPAGSITSTSMNDLDVVLIPSVEFLLKIINTAGRDIDAYIQVVFQEKLTDIS